MTRIKKFLYGIWTLPNTLVGLLFLLGAINGSVEIVEGPLIRWGVRRIANSGGSLLALTLGQVVIGRSKTALTPLT